MIKPFTCVCLILAAGSGLYLYQTKHRAQMLDREIARTLKQTDAARDRIGVLRGEWALLNEPERLAELNQQHLGLRSLLPTQFTALSDLGSRIPAPLPQGRPAVVPEDAPAAIEAPVAVLTKPIVTRMVAAAAPAAPAPARPAAVAQAPVPAPAPAPAVAQVAALPLPPAAAPRIRAAAAPAAPPQTVAAAPLPPAPMAPPRLSAPIMAVSSAPMVVPPTAPGAPRIQGLTTAGHTVAPGIGESVARAAHIRQAAPVQAQNQVQIYGGGVIQAAAAPAISSGGYQGSALGTTARALPPPVPYVAQR